MSLESIQFACSGCGKKLQVAASLAGKKVKCPACSALNPVPQPQGASAGLHGTPSSQPDASLNPSLTNIDPALLPPLVAPLSPSHSPTLSPEELHSSPTLASQEGSSNLDSLETQSDRPPGKPQRDWDFLGPAKEPDEIGRLGHYRILRVLGSGGMGVVFYAEDVLLKRPVALKVMLPRVAGSVASARQRFLREARATAALEHDNIVTIYQVAEDQDIPFIAMQMLRGESLEKRLQREVKLPLPEVLRIGRQIAEGLSVAHRAKLIHRDIKPSNIWLEQGTDRVKLLDFGLALDSTDELNLTQTGTILGTPAYMAPEQAAAAHEVDHRCDLFSLGCVLYRMSTGLPPFSGRGMMSILLALEMHNPDPPSKLNNQLPPAFSGLVMQLLAKKPKQRPKSAQEVVDRLRWVESMITRPTSAAFTNAETVSLVPAPKLAPGGIPKAVPLGGIDKTSIEPAEGDKALKAEGPKLAHAIVATPPGGPPEVSVPTPSPLAAGEPPRAIPLGKPSSSGSITVSDQTPLPQLQRPPRKWPVLLLASSVLLTIVVTWGILFFNGFFSSLEEPDDKKTQIVKLPNKTTKTEDKTTGKTTTGKEPTKTDTGKPIPPVLEFPIDPVHQVHYHYSPYKNFGLLVPATGKTLTYNAEGTSNSILLRVDKEDLHTFGISNKGQWISTETHPPLPAPGAPLQSSRSKNIWQISDLKIRVTQVLDIIPGKQPVDMDGKKRWPLNTCLVAYLLENKDDEPHSVGLRLMLDTKVGSNDGVPFAVPGLPELVTTMADFSGGDVPPFIEAVEFPDLLNPGTVAHLTLKHNGDLEPPGRVSLTAWDKDRRPWDIPVKNMGIDSCVVLYWGDQVLKPGEKRYIGFAYGLGNIFTDSGQKTLTQMGLTVDGTFEPEKDFIVMAYVNNPPPEQTLRLKLPEGLSLVKGNASQVVPQPVKSSKSLVNWTVRAKEPGQYNLAIQSNTKISQQHTVYITSSRPGAGLTKKIFE